LNPLASQSVTNREVVGLYKRQIEKIYPDLVMTWSDYDLSAFWASVLSKTSATAPAQIIWPVCPSSCLFNEVTEVPWDGPSKNCGLCARSLKENWSERRLTYASRKLMPWYKRVIKVKK
jgi:hypothetical protein